jgi:antitoxin PrlF
MPATTMTSKGQITVPKPVRKHLGVVTGDRLEFTIAADGTVRLRPVTGSVKDLYGLLQRPGRDTVSLEEMERGMGEYLAADDQRIRRGEP